MSKYHSIKTTIDNVVFASKKEANRYLELKLLLKGKQIQDLVLQPKYLLQEGFTVLFTREKIRPIYYIADFSYSEEEKKIVEDCKGVRTKEFLIKRKLFLKRYRGLRFVEI